MADRPLPHLQFAVLGIIGASKRSGRQIRAELADLGIKKVGPAFYRLMLRLEEAELVEGWYEQEVVKGQIHRERVYRARAAGLEAWEKTRDLHMEVIRRFSGRPTESSA